MPQPKDKAWLNGHKNKTPLYGVYKDPPQNKGHIQTESEWLEKVIPSKQRPKESRSSNIHIFVPQVISFPYLSEFNSYGIGYEYCHSCFLLVSFASNIFFQPLTFSLYASLSLRWVYCREDIQGSCFCICSASLYVLVGALSPFTFKGTTNVYDPVTIYFIVLGLFLQVFSFSYASCLQKSL